MSSMPIERVFSEAHDEFLERVACPCCGSDDASVHRTSHDRLFGRPGKYHVVRCRVCQTLLMAFVRVREIVCIDLGGLSELEPA